MHGLAAEEGAIPVVLDAVVAAPQQSLAQECPLVWALVLHQE